MGAAGGGAYAKIVADLGDAAGVAEREAAIAGGRAVFGDAAVRHISQIG